MPFKHFLQSETGAVTVDWVVLTAAVVGLGLAAMAVVSNGVGDLSNDITVELASLDTGSMYDWGSGGALMSSTWGDLDIFSLNQTASEAESYAASVLASNGGDYQAAYDQLYQQVLDMTYGNGESIDDFGAFEAMAAANGVSLDTGSNMTYGEMHASYSENGSV
ncbi:MAG TPA: hypothetical protein EYP31_04965 [Roseibacterium sp.]|nr:hypothetical protein [Roseibacterium sp.]